MAKEQEGIASRLLASRLRAGRASSVNNLR
jgi:hypothetical protein